MAKEKYDYYEEELDKIDFHGNFPATVQFSVLGSDKSPDRLIMTKNIDVNEKSAQVIVARLIKEFNIVPNGQAFAEMTIDEMWVAFGNFCQAINNQMSKK